MGVSKKPQAKNSGGDRTIPLPRLHPLLPGCLTLFQGQIIHAKNWEQDKGFPCRPPLFEKDTDRNPYCNAASLRIFLIDINRFYFIPPRSKLLG
jgi:hypothetical protein